MPLLFCLARTSEGAIRSFAKRLPPCAGFGGVRCELFRLKLATVRCGKGWVVVTGRVGVARANRVLTDFVVKLYLYL